MSEKRSSSLPVYDSYPSIEKIEKCTRDISFDHLMGDERTKDAILRNLQVIGEASKNCPPLRQPVVLNPGKTPASGLHGDPHV
jgi:uncharacterized protein with HEPN domain